MNPPFHSSCHLIGPLKPFMGFCQRCVTNGLEEQTTIWGGCMCASHSHPVSPIQECPVPLFLVFSKSIFLKSHCHSVDECQSQLAIFPFLSCLVWFVNLDCFFPQLPQSSLHKCGILPPPAPQLLTLHALFPSESFVRSRFN